MAVTTGPAPEAVRQRLLSILAASSPPGVATADLRRCLSEIFSHGFVHEHVYHHLLVLERRGDVTRTARRPKTGRHTLWSLKALTISADQ